MYLRSCDVGSAPLFGGPEHTMSPAAAIFTVLDDAEAATVRSAIRPAATSRVARVQRIRRACMRASCRLRRFRVELGFQLGARSLLVAVALLGEGLRVDVVAPNLPEP